MSVTDPDQLVPEEFVTDEFVLRSITADDAELDYDAVMETRQDLRLWSQSTWPADDFTVEDNRKDLVDMAARRSTRRAFDYTVLDASRTRCLGCVYIFPPDASFLRKATVMPLGEQAWDDLDAVVYFWVRTSLADAGLDERLLAALRAWFTDVWRLDRVAFDVSEPYRHQIDLLDRTDLVPLFELRDPEKTGKDIVYG